MFLFKLLIISTFMIASFGHSNAQCSIKVSHEAKASSSAALGSIQLKFEANQPRSFEIVLFKISGEPKEVESRTETSPTTVVFKNLEPGDYVVSIDQRDGCKVMIGGMEGISIKDDRNRK